MAQIKIPVEFPLQIVLQNNVIEQNTELKDESPLLPWLAEKNYNLNTDQEAGKKAVAQENLRAKQDAASQTAYKNRDNKFSSVFIFVRAAAQVLKKFYSTNTAVLKDWGIPITDSGRIDYPSSYEERNTIATNLFTQLATFADGKSPLAAYIKTNNVDIADLTKKNTDSAKNNTDAIAAGKAAENATETRDLLWKAPMQHIREIGDYLKSINPNNPRALGDWGFVVDNSNKKTTLRKTKLIIGQTKTTNGIKIGSVLTNTGKEIIIVYKGKDTTGDSTKLLPGEKLGMVSGYSTITVQNTSTLENAEYTVEVSI